MLAIDLPIMFQNPIVLKLKTILQCEIPDIEFHKAKRSNESDRVTIKRTTATAMHLSEDDDEDIATNMKSLYDAASLLRKAIKKSKIWTFAGSLDNVNDEHLPK